jgi:hypothetical protein
MIDWILNWLHDLPLSSAIRVSAWMFPTIESAHVIAITTVIGSIAIVDLRLLGVTSHRKPVTELSTEVLPWTWAFFMVAAITGGLMFMSKAPAYFGNTPFRLKMVLLACAGLNMVAFHFLIYRSVHRWDRDVPTLRSAKIAGLLSLTFWIGVVAAGRWIGFTIEG